MRVFVFTSPKYAYLIRPFAYLFNHFWGASQEVVIAGVPNVDFDLPVNFSVSAYGANRPASEWQQGAVEFLQSVDDRKFVLMLEDYFLCRQVDVVGVDMLGKYMEQSPNCVRMDLTTDILHGYGDGRNAKEVSACEHYDIIEKRTDSSYRMSLQAGIFDREYFIKMCMAGGSPWELELYSLLQDDESVSVYGCRQWPVRYVNAVDKGKLNWEQINRLPAWQRKTVESLLP